MLYFSIDVDSLHGCFSYSSHVSIKARSCDVRRETKTEKNNPALSSWILLNSSREEKKIHRVEEMRNFVRRH